MDSFKYKTVFHGFFVKASADAKIDKYLSRASLDDLKKLGLEAHVDLESNIDLTGVVFNAAVVNRLNKNDEAINTEVAKKIKNLFIHKPLNLEHKVKTIVGHIITAGWSTFGQNELLTDEEIKDLQEPFNLALGGVVYNTVNEEFADLLSEASDETSSRYNLIASSWEICFNKYYLAVGSRNISECEIIKDEEVIKDLKKHLRINGGSGKLPDGRIVGRLIADDAQIVPLGVAFTSRPAAEVSGVKVLSEDSLDLDETEEMDDSKKIDTSCANLGVDTLKEKENISQTEKNVVKNNSNKTNTSMKIKDIKELLALASSQEGLSEASVSDFIANQLEVKAKEWESEKTSREEALKNAMNKSIALEAELAETKSKLNQVSEDLNKLSQNLAAKQKDDDFQNRMNFIASEYVLSEKETALVAKEINGLSEESYASWIEKFAVFNEGKKKDVIEAAKISIASQIEEKVKEEVAKSKMIISSAAATIQEPIVSQTALDSVTELKNQQLPNSTSTTSQKSLAQEWAEAFGGKNVSIKL